MRLRSLSVRGFRAFKETTQIFMDADVVLVSGRNGTGKTSLFDAITFAICGVVPRLKKQESIVSLYAGESSANVTLELVDGRGSIVTIMRTTDGSLTSCRVSDGAHILDGREASEHLLKLFWPSNEPIEERQAALLTTMTRSVYLQQDLIKQFVQTDPGSERFRVLADLLGAGRYVDLLRQLEHSRNLFSRNVLASLENTIATLNGRHQMLSSRIAGLAAEVSDSVEPEALSEWSRAVASLSLGVVSARPPATISEVESLLRAVDDAAAKAQDRKLRVDRVIADVNRLAEYPDREKELLELRTQLEAHISQLQLARRAITVAQEAASERRTFALKQRSAGDEMRQLASLALRHLGDRCPVCEQTYDREATTERLRHLSDAIQSVADPADGEVTVALNHIINLERVVNSLRLTIASHEESMRSRNELLRQIEVATKNLELTSNDSERLPQALGLARKEIDGRLEVITSLQERGQRFLRTFSSITETNQRRELQRQLDLTRSELMKATAEHESAGSRYEMASRIIEALRLASRSFIDDRVKRFSPLLNRLYSRIDPHPTFKEIAFVSRTERGHGIVDTILTDAETGRRISEPGDYLSSSELNALAVVIFLSLNLSAARLPLDVAMLDDPIQSLDDVNFLGVVDVLRRARGQRQILLSTHDVRLADVIQRKLRPVSKGQETIRLDVAHTDRTLVTVAPTELVFQGPSLRVVA